MTDVHGEVKCSGGDQHTRYLGYDCRGILRVIHHVVGQDYIEGIVRERECFTVCRHSGNTALPCWKKCDVMMSQRVNAYAALRAEEKDKTMRPTSDLQDTRIGSNALNLLKHASYLMRFGQQIPTGIIPGLEEVVRFVFLKLKHNLKRTLRPLVPLMRQHATPPATVYRTAHLDLPEAILSHMMRIPRRYYSGNSSHEADTSRLFFESREISIMSPEFPGLYHSAASDGNERKWPISF